jgi:hypothetical protein
MTHLGIGASSFNNDPHLSIQRVRTALNEKSDTKTTIPLKDKQGNAVTTSSGTDFAFGRTEGVLKSSGNKQPTKKEVLNFQYQQKVGDTFEKRHIAFDQNLYDSIWQAPEKQLSAQDKKALLRLLDGNQKQTPSGKIKNVKHPIPSSAWAAQLTTKAKQEDTSPTTLSGLLINAREHKANHKVSDPKGGLFVTRTGQNPEDLRVYTRRTPTETFQLLTKDPQFSTPSEQRTTTQMPVTQTPTQGGENSASVPSFKVPLTVQAQEKPIVLSQGDNTLIKDPSDRDSQFNVHVNADGKVDAAALTMKNGTVNPENTNTEKDAYAFSVNTADPNKPVYEVHKNGTKLADLSDPAALARKEDEVLLKG